MKTPICIFLSINFDCKHWNIKYFSIIVLILIVCLYICSRKTSRKTVPEVSTKVQIRKLLQINRGLSKTNDGGTL